MSDRTATERIHFGTIKEAIEPPNLIEVQLNSYVDFLQKDVPSEQAEKHRSASRFQGSFPDRELRRKGDARFQPLRNWRAETERARGAARRPDLQRAAARHLPAQGRKGDEGRESLHGRNPAHDAVRARSSSTAPSAWSFRQLHRSPGIAFESSIHLNGKVLYSFRIIPDRGSWIEVQFDTSDLLYIYLDRRKRRRKFLATTFLRALGYGSDEEVIKLFYNIEKLKLSEKLDEEESRDQGADRRRARWRSDRRARLRAAHPRRPFARSWRSGIRR